MYLLGFPLASVVTRAQMRIRRGSEPLEVTESLGSRRGEPERLAAEEPARKVRSEAYGTG